MLQLKNAKNVFTLRDAGDVKKISKAAKKARKVVIIGGGAIGIEVASLLREKGKSVAILEVASQLMPGAYDIGLANKVKEILEKKGIKVKLGIQVKEIKKKMVVTSRGNIGFDLVICSCGVRANVELAQKLDCRLGKFGILVNQFCQTSQKGIWAIGDCAQAKSFITKKPIPSQLATTAVLMGKIAGMNIAGKKEKLEGVLNPAVSCFFDYAVGRVGLTEKEAKNEKISVKVASAQSTNQYPSQMSAKPLEIKLVFNQKNSRLIGAQVFGGKKDVGMRINLLSLAISQRLTAEKLSKLNYCAHPEETPLPFAEPMIMAAEQVVDVLRHREV